MSDQSPQTQRGARVSVLTQYIKDLSFENPGATVAVDGQPEIETGADVSIRSAVERPDLYEVELRLAARARHGDTVLFVCELVYAGLFELNGISESNKDVILMVECPRLLFPFSRRIIADITRDGGLPPVLFDPIDFAALYRQRHGQEQAPENGADGLQG